MPLDSKCVILCSATVSGMPEFSRLDNCCVNVANSCSLGLRCREIAFRIESGALDAGDPVLTGRETEVLRLVAAGRSNREIAAALVISPKTASVHVSNILAKLGAATRTEAAVKAHQLLLL